MGTAARSIEEPRAKWAGQGRSRLCNLWKPVMPGVLLLLIGFCWGSSGCGPSLGARTGGDRDGSSELDASTIPEVDGAPIQHVDTSDPDQCQANDIPIVRNPTRLMILLDWSGSMAWPDENWNFYWNIAQQAMISMLEAWTDREDIVFGLDIFPDLEGCGGNCCEVAGPPVVDCGDESTEALINRVRSLPAPIPDADTPLCAGMDAFNDPAYAPNFTGVAGPRYLLVLSDGMEDCQESGEPQLCGTAPDYAGAARIVSSLLDNDVRTFALGFGDGADAAQLNVIAGNGGTAHEQFIEARDGPALQAALQEITSSAVECIYDIDDPEVTSHPGDVNFYLGDEVIPSDPGCASGTGWTWLDEPPSRIKFCDSTCGELQTTSVGAVSATYGCPTVFF